MKNSIMIAALIAIVVGGAAFFGGMKYQQGKQRSNFRQFAGQQGQGLGNGGNRMVFRPLNGEILSSDDKSIIVKLQDESSKIIILSDKTTVNKTSEGSKSDLKTGEKVTVIGTTNSEGSITAQTISIGNNFPGIPTGGAQSGQNPSQ